MICLSSCEEEVVVHCCSIPPVRVRVQTQRMRLVADADLRLEQLEQARWAVTAGRRLDMAGCVYCCV